MSEAGAETEPVGSGAGRLARAWRGLSHERRQAAYASLGLFFSLFLPWYQHTVIAKGSPAALEPKSFTVTGWGAFSFIEIVVLLVALGVLAVLFRRGEGRGLAVPGGDGTAILAAGSLASLLIVWGIVNQQGTSGPGQIVIASGIEWGIFVALAMAVLLGSFGARIRGVHEPDPEPPRPHDDGRGPYWGPSDPQSGSATATQPATVAGAPRPGGVRPPRPEPAPRPVAAPRPAAADGPATRVSGARSDEASGPPTRISERERPPDEQLTMPLESEGDTRPSSG